MSEESKILAKSLKKLTTAVWVVAFSLIAIIVLSIVPWVFPDFYMKQFTRVSTDLTQGLEQPTQISSVVREASAPIEQFYELPIEEQIQDASLIAVTNYEQAPDGRMKAIITDILKKDPDTVSYYDIGDEHPSSSYYPSEGSSRGDGMIIFFTGSPAEMRLSMTYEGDRIRGLGDMPMALFRAKCNKQEIYTETSQ